MCVNQPCGRSRHLAVLLTLVDDGLGLGFLQQPLIGCLAGEAAVGSVVVVVVLPFLELVVEGSGVVDHDTIEEAVELLSIDAMGPLDAPMFVKLRRGAVVVMSWLALVGAGWRRSRGRCSASGSG
jgi:hypothetical protein